MKFKTQSTIFVHGGTCVPAPGSGITCLVLLQRLQSLFVSDPAQALNPHPWSIGTLWAMQFLSYLY